MADLVDDAGPGVKQTSDFGDGRSESGANRRLEGGQSVSALPGYFRHRLVPLLLESHRPRMRSKQSRVEPDAAEEIENDNLLSPL